MVENHAVCHAFKVHSESLKKYRKSVFSLGFLPTSCTLCLLAEHKSRFACNGKRNRTEFVKRGAMSDDTLRSGKMKM